ncbi:MAG: UDP-3-O-(3-hydroxymyristoyl)glucosamine N-acyltransferase [Gammaproteobacteria bacterium]|nr:UDP-3-O-(3-hydroxymyristoyl)glucosamine N-acyltransferase [Gammaproteobacteria bacterium]
MEYSLGEIARLINAELIGDADLLINGIAPLSSATTHQISFFVNSKYRSHLKQTDAGAVLLSYADVNICPVHSLVCKQPYVGYVKVANLLNPSPELKPGIHPSAVIEESATIAESVSIGANTYVGSDVVIKDNVSIGHGCIIERDCIIDEDSRLMANVTLNHMVRIGKRVVLHSGVVIGSDGFGLVNDEGQWLKIPQLGTVNIGNDVEIGANTAVDRGALDDTRIEDGVKIDNLVQIGHNVIIGENSAIAGCAVIAGSVVIGKRCMIGGATAIAGHVSIVDDVIITGLSGVTNSISSPGKYSGSMTTTENLTWRKNMVRLRHLDELVRRVNVMEDKIKTEKTRK